MCELVGIPNGRLKESTGGGAERAPAVVSGLAEVVSSEVEDARGRRQAALAQRVLAAAQGTRGARPP
eukprot:4251031-Pyramimonas_sp.AAC.1